MSERVSFLQVSYEDISLRILHRINLLYRLILPYTLHRIIHIHIPYSFILLQIPHRIITLHFIHQSTILHTLR